MKNMFKVAFVAAFICMAGYSVYASQQEIELSELASQRMFTMYTRVLDNSYDSKRNGFITWYLK